jgi:hypothetical protein
MPDASSDGVPCARPYSFGRSVCASLPGFQPWDEYPIRSPLLMADVLLHEVQSYNLSVVEIGTRHGDIFTCLSRLARSRRVVAVEKEPEYCAALRSRGSEVVCEEINAKTVHRALPDGDVYFMW